MELRRQVHSKKHTVWDIYTFSPFPAPQSVSAQRGFTHYSELTTSAPHETAAVIRTQKEKQVARLEHSTTYRAGCVQNLQHALLPVHFHLLNRREIRVIRREMTGNNHDLSDQRSMIYLSVRVFYCGIVLLHKDALDELHRL